MGLILKSSLFDLEEIDELLKGPERPPEPLIEFRDDPVALACSSYRYWIEAPHIRWMSLEEAVVLPKDREQAAELKKYYRDRFVIEALSRIGGNETSTFRKKMYKVLCGEAVLTKADVGLLYRLPYFYHEDRGLDEVISQTSTATDSHHGSSVSGEFSLIKKVFRSRKHGDYHDYWLRKSSSEAPFLFTVKTDNPLNPIWNSLIERPVVLSGRIWTKTHQGHYRKRQYYQLAIHEIHSR